METKIVNETKDVIFSTLFPKLLATKADNIFLGEYETKRIEQNYKSSVLLRITISAIILFLVVFNLFSLKTGTWVAEEKIFNILHHHFFLLVAFAVDGIVWWTIKVKSISFKAYYFRWFAFLFLIWSVLMSMVSVGTGIDIPIIFIGVLTVSIAFHLRLKEILVLYGTTAVFLMFSSIILIEDTAVLFDLFYNGLCFIVLGFLVSSINSSFQKNLFLNKKIIEQQKKELAHKTGMLKKRNHLLWAKNKELKTQGKIISNKNKKMENLLSKINDSNQKLNQFAATVAHDLKAPLRTISAFSNIIYKKHYTAFGEDDREILEFIVHDCNNLQGLVDGLLRYSSVSEGKDHPNIVNAQDALNNVLKNLRVPIIESGAIINIPQSLPLVKGKKTLLEQVFLNLITNALKFKKADTAPRIEISWEKTRDKFLEFRISDNGIGIETEEHKAIFEVFRKLHPKSEYEGSGIGLSTCQKIVHSFGGKIWVNSKPGDGSSFCFTFPQVE